MDWRYSVPVRLKPLPRHKVAMRLYGACTNRRRATLGAKRAGAIYSITRDTEPADFVRAALEAVVCKQMTDQSNYWRRRPLSVRLMAGWPKITAWCNFWQTSSVKVDRPVVRETTALGAAMLALIQSDPSITLDDLATRWQCDATFIPCMDVNERLDLVSGWDRAMRRTLA